MNLKDNQYYEQLYLFATGLSLAEKVKKSIANLREYEAEALKLDPEDGYYLCNSFGKDSTVIRHLAMVAGVIHTNNYNVTTLDPPELIYFGRKHHAETVFHRPKLNMLVRLANSPNRGAPTRIKRWCCSEYKESAATNKVKIFGVRASESPRRKATWKTWQKFKGESGYVLNPILYWTDKDVWDYIKSNGLPYCSLYDEGWTRLGCIGCPMAGEKRIREFERWPKFEKAWKNGFKKFWENWRGYPLKNPRWVSMEGKHKLIPLPSEELERCFVKERNREENGFWTLRRWFDLRGWTCWQDLWSWWMEEELQPEEENDCQMGLF